MLAYVRHMLVNYVYQDMDSLPSHEFIQLLTSEHLETFHAAFSSLRGSLEDIEEVDERSTFHHDAYRSRTCNLSDKPSTAEPRVSETVLPGHAGERRIILEQTMPSTIQETPKAPRPTERPSQQADLVDPCDSPTRSDEGYGSSCGELYADKELEQDSEETRDEIAALGIIDECDEVPDYGVALEPASFTSLSPLKSQETTRRVSGSSNKSGGRSPAASPTKARLAELSGRTPKPRARAVSKSGASENARNLMTMGYTLALLGEKFEKARSIEGSVKSVILKAGQAIEKSQAGSVHGKSRYGGSRYAGSRYGGSKFGGSKRSVARSVVLEETLPSWGF